MTEQTYTTLNTTALEDIQPGDRVTAKFGGQSGPDSRSIIVTGWVDACDSGDMYFEGITLWATTSGAKSPILQEILKIERPAAALPTKPGAVLVRTGAAAWLNENALNGQYVESYYSSAQERVSPFNLFWQNPSLYEADAEVLQEWLSLGYLEVAFEGVDA